MRRKTWDELTPELQELMLKRSIESGKTRKLALKSLKNSLSSGFIYAYTPEGHDWWWAQIWTGTSILKTSAVDDLINFIDNLNI